MTELSLSTLSLSLSLSREEHKVRNAYVTSTFITFALKCNFQNMCLNVETMISLFDTYFAGILKYGCEVWGSHNVNDVEKVDI